MVAGINFRLIIFFLIFFKLQGALNSQDIMKDINISITQALESYKSKKLKIIDIRTHKEWKMTGIIPNSYLINMHEEDFSENINFIEETKKVLNDNKEFNIAFICASGARSEIAANSCNPNLKQSEYTKNYVGKLVDLYIKFNSIC